MEVVAPTQYDLAYGDVIDLMKRSIADGYNELTRYASDIDKVKMTLYQGTRQLCYRNDIDDLFLMNVRSKDPVECCANLMRYLFCLGATETVSTMIKFIASRRVERRIYRYLFVSFIENSPDDGVYTSEYVRFVTEMEIGEPGDAIKDMIFSHDLISIALESMKKRGSAKRYCVIFLENVFPVQPVYKMWTTGVMRSLDRAHIEFYSDLLRIYASVATPAFLIHLFFTQYTDIGLSMKKSLYAYEKRRGGGDEHVIDTESFQMYVGAVTEIIESYNLVQDICHGQLMGLIQRTQMLVSPALDVLWNEYLRIIPVKTMKWLDINHVVEIDRDETRADMLNCMLYHGLQISNRDAVRFALERGGTLDVKIKPESTLGYIRECCNDSPRIIQLLLVYGELNRFSAQAISGMDDSFCSVTLDIARKYFELQCVMYALDKEDGKRILFKDPMQFHVTFGVNMVGNLSLDILCAMISTMSVLNSGRVHSMEMEDTEEMYVFENLNQKTQMLS